MKELTPFEKKQVGRYFTRNTYPKFQAKHIRTDRDGFEYITDDYVQEDNEENLVSLTQVVVSMGDKVYIINADGCKEIEGRPDGNGSSLYLHYNTQSGNLFEEQIEEKDGKLLTKFEQIGWDTNKEVYQVPTIIPSKAISLNSLWGSKNRRLAMG